MAGAGMMSTNDTAGCPPLALPARIDSTNVVEVLARMSEAGRRHVSEHRATCCPIDLAGLEHFDSTVLSMLLEVARQVGTPVAVINPPAKLRELAVLYGVDELLLGQSAAPVTAGAAGIA